MLSKELVESQVEELKKEILFIKTMYNTAFTAPNKKESDEDKADAELYVDNIAETVGFKFRALFKSYEDLIGVIDGYKSIVKEFNVMMEKMK